MVVGLCVCLVHRRRKVGGWWCWWWKDMIEGTKK
uniref:Uncharacterized protein n=1 Tax=Human herpesvirus 2 TaxID=10310 RepID=A0A481TME6_HHV2|nr:hypothetical protein [Human alphaherpesvirus 2]